MTITPALRDLPNTPSYIDEEKNMLFKTTFVEENIRMQMLILTERTLFGKKKKVKLMVVTNSNWEGNDNGAFPPDPSGAAGQIIMFK